MALFGSNTERSVDLSYPKPASVRTSNPPNYFDQILIYPIPRSQSSDSRTSSFYPFSPTSRQTRTSQETMHGTLSSIV